MRKSELEKRLDKLERLTEWEEGRLRPTVTQLRKAANVYKRPLAVFFLPRPPAQPQPLHDFRRFPDREHAHLSPELLLEMRRGTAARPTTAVRGLPDTVPRRERRASCLVA